MKKARRRAEARRDPFLPTTQIHGLCSRSQPKGVLKWVLAPADSLIRSCLKTQAGFAMLTFNLRFDTLAPFDRYSNYFDTYSSFPPIKHLFSLDNYSIKGMLIASLIWLNLVMSGLVGNSSVCNIVIRVGLRGL